MTLPTTTPCNAQPVVALSRASAVPPAMHRTKPLHQTALSGALFLALSAASCAAMGQDIRLAEDLGERGFRILGAAAGDGSGFSVSGASDVNGDGLADLIIGAPGVGPNGDRFAGTSYVVFGELGAQADVDLNALDDRGFRILGAAAGDFSGMSVSGAGDVNGDGLADFVVGAPNAHPNGDIDAGTSYVVFGTSGEQDDVDLNALGNRGFRILGAAAQDRSGFSVSGAGDVNGDGLADVIIGAVWADPHGNIDAGTSYVVFGKSGEQADVNLNALGERGFSILGAAVGDFSGISASGAGDLNGDGLADLIIGAPRAAPDGTFYAGTSYVVFGASGEQANVDLNALGARGFKILGAAEFDFSGVCVSGAGDVNGDGLADLIIGAHGTDPNGNNDAGTSYVVFGKEGEQADIKLNALGERGFRILGASANDTSGKSVSGAGDVNGDGLGDLIIGAMYANFRAGTSYVVFGQSDTQEIDLDSLGDRGFRVRGSTRGDYAGASVSAAGDVNGDGLADLIIGAFGDFSNGNPEAGTSYVVFGSTDLASATYRTTQVVTRDCFSTDPFWSRVGIVGDGSNNDSPDARIGLSMCSPDAASAQATVTLHRAAATASNGSPAQFASPVRLAAVSWEVNWAYQSPTAPIGIVEVHYTDADIAGLEEGALQLYREVIENGDSRFEPMLMNGGPDLARNRLQAFVQTIPIGAPLRLALGAPGEPLPPRGDAMFADGFED